MKTSSLTLSVLALALGWTTHAQADLSKISKMENFVPITQAVSKIGKGERECSNYKAEDKTCTTLGTMEVAGDTITAEIKFLVNPANPRIVGILSDAMSVENGLGCTDYKEATLSFEGEISDDVANGVRGIVLQEARSNGKVCVGYFKNGDGFKAFSYLADGSTVANVPPSLISIVESKTELRMQGR